MSQTANFAMALLNTTFFVILVKLIRTLTKKNIFRILFDQPLIDVVAGQYISLILPLTCPWVFFILGRYDNLTSKVNISLQYLFFAINLTASIGYLFYAAAANKRPPPQKNK